jgi:hypothetical protein
VHLVCVFFNNLVSPVLDFAMEKTDSMLRGTGANVQAGSGTATGDIGGRLEACPYPILSQLLQYWQFAFLAPFINQCRLGRFEKNTDNFMLVLLRAHVWSHVD